MSVFHIMRQMTKMRLGPKLIPFSRYSPTIVISHTPAVGCHQLPPGPCGYLSSHSALQQFSQYEIVLLRDRKKERKKKRKEEHLYSAFLAKVVHSKRSGMDHTVLPANNTMPAFPS